MFYKSLPSVCIHIRIPLPLLGNAWVKKNYHCNGYIRNIRGIIGRVLYAFRVVRKENSRLVLPRISCFRIKWMGHQIMVWSPTSNFMLNLLAIPQFALNCAMKLTLCRNVLHAYILAHMCYSFYFLFHYSERYTFQSVALGHASSTASDVADTFHSRWHPCKAIRTFSPQRAPISEAARRLLCCPIEWQGGHWAPFRAFKYNSDGDLSWSTSWVVLLLGIIRAWASFDLRVQYVRMNTRRETHAWGVWLRGLSQVGQIYSSAAGQETACHFWNSKLRYRLLKRTPPEERTGLKGEEYGFLGFNDV